ncbi:MAG TPA: CopG family transcriptional regulator [Spirochaetota bacterium]|nr:CopG family transcriptional regulator [Spirochaetota bacterium]
MKTSTVNISFQPELLKQLDDYAKKEVRSRSELLREAVRFYLKRMQNWDSIYQYGEQVAREKNIKEADILKVIKVQRRSKK